MLIQNDLVKLELGNLVKIIFCYFYAVLLKKIWRNILIVHNIQ